MKVMALTLLIFLWCNMTIMIFPMLLCFMYLDGYFLTTERKVRDVWNRMMHGEEVLIYKRQLAFWQYLKSGLSFPTGFYYLVLALITLFSRYEVV